MMLTYPYRYFTITELICFAGGWCDGLNNRPCKPGTYNSYEQATDISWCLTCPSGNIYTMIINLLRLPGSYWLYRERIIYHQAGGFPYGGHSKFLVSRKKVLKIAKIIASGFWAMGYCTDGICKCIEAYRGQLHLRSVTWVALIYIIYIPYRSVVSLEFNLAS